MEQLLATATQTQYTSTDAPSWRGHDRVATLHIDAVSDGKGLLILGKRLVHQLVDVAVAQGVVRAERTEARVGITAADHKDLAELGQLSEQFRRKQLERLLG